MTKGVLGVKRRGTYLDPKGNCCTDRCCPMSRHRPDECELVDAHMARSVGMGQEGLMLVAKTPCDSLGGGEFVTLLSVLGGEAPKVAVRLWVGVPGHCWEDERRRVDQCRLPSSPGRGGGGGTRTSSPAGDIVRGGIVS